MAYYVNVCLSPNGDYAKRKIALNLRTLQSCCPEDKSSYKYRLKHFEQANNADLLLLLMSKLNYS